MKYFNINIGEYAVAKGSEEELRTFALGSCVAVLIIDPIQLVAGMAHIALPDSSIEPQKSKVAPCYFADTGIPKLLEAVQQKGASSISQHLVVKIAGGISTLKNTIGIRNIEKVREVLKKHSLVCQSEDIGGMTPRTLFYRPGQAKVTVQSPDGSKWEL